MTYQIKDWDKHFEKAQSRQAQIHTWVAMPNHHDGDSYTELVEDHKNGTAHFGVWCTLIQVCSQQEAPRDGWLTKNGSKDGKSHTPKSLSRKTRLPEKIIIEALPRLIEIGWLIEETNSRLTAEQQPTTSPLLQQNSTIQNSTGQNKEYTPDFLEFWETWKGSRKSKKWATFQSWLRQSPDLEKCLTHLRAAMESKAWIQGFDPLPTSYVNQRMFEDDPPEPWDGTEDGKIVDNKRWNEVHYG